MYDNSWVDEIYIVLYLHAHDAQNSLYITNHYVIVTIDREISVCKTFTG